MVTGNVKAGRWGVRTLGWLGFCLTLLAVLLVPAAAMANDRAKLFATAEKNYGRIVIDFPARLDLPPYKLQSDNGVLSIVFDAPVDVTLPDIAALVPNYVSVARVDPDGRGIRFGLRSTFSVDHMEAGEQLFIDLLPPNWQGLPPGLPPEVIANLARRAKEAAVLADQRRKAEQARISHAAAEVRMGRNPTFMRVEVEWNVDTEASYAFDPKSRTGNLDFEWPVPIDLHLVQGNLPKELQGVDNLVTADGSRIVFHPAEGTVPRFYKVSPRDFIVDIDTASSVPADPNPAAAATAKAFQTELQASRSGASWWLPALRSVVPPWAEPALAVFAAGPPAPITPTISTVGSTVRITFPFDRETPAAVFRRGNVVWMLFDTTTSINAPPSTTALDSFATSLTVVPAGELQVVRLDVSPQRLATLGSEGRAWVLSIGDMLLNATEPLTLNRRTDRNGLYEIVADLGRPARLHHFHDPVVGDTLDVVTTYPPARGVVRDLDFVDFEALRSVHGLVIRPSHDDVSVKVDKTAAVISAPGGLIVSSPDTLASAAASAASSAPRTDFIDLGPLKEDNPVKFNEKQQKLAAAAASTEGAARDAARLDLARFYLANRFGYEAIGVLHVLQDGLKTDDLRNTSQIMLAAADTIAGRPADALPILDSPAFADEVDAKVWRALAETDAGDYAAAKSDAIAAAPVIGSYPVWVQTRFLLAAIRSALETGDTQVAEQFRKQVSFGDLDRDQVSLYQLLSGRIAEAEGRTDEALDTYGQVIAADIRPTRAEAVYRTILVLDRTGKLDLAKATKTLAAEAMLWRGDSLEAHMDKLLASLYFRAGRYRDGFETAKSALEVFPSSPTTEALADQAQGEFEDLYLNGKADQLPPVDALSLYYDFRSLTPPGTRGDEMIRNLAQRLVKVDLLSQAADLLTYQVDNRLKGAAKAEVAVQLALVQIANRQPQAALRILNSTELADLPPGLDRRRRLLEARALIDSNRLELALDVLGSIAGRDADQLRIEANWDAKNYEAAGDLLEAMYTPNAAGNSGPALTQSGRMDILRAAVAFALADDKIGLSRLRAKFSDALAKGPEWPMFDYVTSTIAQVGDPRLAAAAKAVAGVDSLNAFLSSYRQVYGNAPLVPDKAAPADGSSPGPGTPTASATPSATGATPTG